MQYFWSWVRQNKLPIISAIILILTFLVSRGILQQDIVTLIIQILSVFGIVVTPVGQVIAGYRIRHAGRGSN